MGEDAAALRRCRVGSKEGGNADGGVSATNAGVDGETKGRRCEGLGGLIGGISDLRLSEC